MKRCQTHYKRALKPTESDKCTFCLKKEEYIALRREVDATIKELSTVERNCLLSVAAIYAWLFSNSAPNDFVNLAWNIPLLITILSILRTIAIDKHLKILGSYLQKIENDTVTHREGWESYFRNNGRGIQGTMRICYWAFFLFITFLAYCIHFFK